MRKIFSSLLIVLVGLNVSFAQVDRSVRPEASAARQLEFGDYEQFTLENGQNLESVRELLADTHVSPSDTGFDVTLSGFQAAVFEVKIR